MITLSADFITGNVTGFVLGLLFVLVLFSLIGVHK